MYEVVKGVGTSHTLHKRGKEEQSAGEKSQGWTSVLIKMHMIQRPFIQLTSNRTSVSSTNKRDPIQRSCISPESALHFNKALIIFAIKSVTTRAKMPEKIHTIMPQIIQVSATSMAQILQTRAQFYKLKFQTQVSSLKFQNAGKLRFRGRSAKKFDSIHHIGYQGCNLFNLGL